MSGLSERMDRSERLRELKCIFVSDALNDARELIELLTESRALAQTLVRDRCRKLSHDLRGTGGCYGFDRISCVAARFEDALLADGPVDVLRKTALELEEAVRGALAELGESRP